MKRMRSSLEVTWAVWRALFLREATSRMSAGRGAGLWLLLDPVIQVVLLALVFKVLRASTIGGVDFVMFLVTGVIAYDFFSNTRTTATNAVSANRALFAYRQVRPVDTVLARSALELILLVLVSAILLFAAGLIGWEALPRDPFGVALAWTGLWLAGVGTGLVFSVGVELIPEIGRVLGFIGTPLYFGSGIMIPPLSIPQPYRDWLMFNPLIHGVEAVRMAFFRQYHSVPDVSLSYLYGFALVTMFLGLALHARFALRLVTK